MDPYVGEIRIFSGNYAPVGWAICQGQTLPIRTYTALYSVIGNQYGGDGKTNFKLPDMQDRASIHQGAGPGLTPRTIGETDGDAKVTLTINEIPKHTHLPNCTTTGGTSESPENMIWSGTPGFVGPKVYSSETQTPNTTMNVNVLTSAGGNQAHNNMQPLLGLSFIIALEGVYPPRP
ncbi:phage tail protein [Paenibacillus sp. L3-i20]|uniref:phage tail protein n=1 Tax=Paenibacillus sp. L3-i20 TaxID=2905833 RepID=UPI001EE1255C|nr:tail fiber protein [Paenibacillus sp. L3-i20]GKU78214.1 microcystin dependent MdpB family protein [Paenibacillus sp. L3-i20]